MDQKTRDIGTLHQIIEACIAIESFMNSQDENSFLQDSKTVSATLHKLMVIGEATKRISKDFREDHKEIPWKAIVGIRE